MVICDRATECHDKDRCRHSRPHEPDREIKNEGMIAMRWSCTEPGKRACCGTNADKDYTLRPVTCVSAEMEAEGNCEEMW